MIFYLRGKGTTFQLRNQDFSYIYAIKILKKERFIFQTLLSLLYIYVKCRIFAKLFKQ